MENKTGKNTEGRPGFDVAIVGGGVCGCSLLYALSRYNLRVVLLEATNDVGVATTKANSAILHAGYDPEPGTLMAKYNVEGNQLAWEICERLDILALQCGSLVLAFSDDERAEVECLYRQGVENGVAGLRIVEQAELREMEPHVSPKALCALYAPTGGVVNPWELAFAQAEVAVRNGAQVWLDAAVTAIEKTGDAFEIQTEQGPLTARQVVNAAGIKAGEVAEMVGPKRFAIYPSRGEYFLLDKPQNHLARQVIFQTPNTYGKGVLVSPTVHGNLIVGPNAHAATDTATTAEGLAEVKKLALLSVPDINFRKNIRNFAGLRAYSDASDFIVGPSPDVPGFYNIAGIKSPGLTAAVAIAQDMVRMLAQGGMPLEEKRDYQDGRRVKRFNHMSQAQRAAAIEENPLYGRILCRCETITEGDVVDALHRPLPPRSLDAVKRRCGPGMGRCQGGFCGPRVQAIIARELGVPQGDVPQDRTGMDIIIGYTKDGEVVGNG